jgi:hypothetical protein
LKKKEGNEEMKEWAKIFDETIAKEVINYVI